MFAYFGFCWLVLVILDASKMKHTIGSHPIERPHCTVEIPDASTPSLHHKICAPEGPTLGKSCSIAYQQKGARATQALENILRRNLL